MTGRAITLLAAVSMLTSAPLEAQVEELFLKERDKTAQNQAASAMEPMMAMCTMMQSMSPMMSMHGMSAMQDGMGSMMMGDAAMGMPGPGVLLGAREALALTDEQVAKLEQLADEAQELRMSHMDGMMDAHEAVVTRAAAVLDDEQRARLHSSMQLMRGMMKGMMGHMGEGTPGPTDEHGSHHR